MTSLWAPSSEGWYRVQTLRCFCGAILSNDGPPLVCGNCGSVFTFELIGPSLNIVGVDGRDYGDETGSN